MCRLLIYKGTEPIQLSHLLTRPCHSIINQAFDSRLRLDRRRPINGDGFGVGWYDPIKDPELGNQPCIFNSITPAWNNSNLTRLAEKIKSPLVFAHVRATTAGSLSQDNCHPWHFSQLMWMHNGGIAEFTRLKRQLQSTLSDELYNFPQGNTDSEWAFALFLSMLTDPHAESFTQHELRDAMLKTISTLNKWAREANITEPSLLNFCVTDGHTVVATRYISSKQDEAASLYFSSGTTFDEYAPGGHYRMSKRDKRENIILIASEPLTFEQGTHFFVRFCLAASSEIFLNLVADWMEIPTNTLMVITPKMNVLQIPIIDEFHVSDPLQAKKRGSDFAAQKGLLSSAYGARRGGSVPSPLQPAQDELEAAVHDGTSGEDFPRVEAVNVAAA